MTTSLDQSRKVTRDELQQSYEQTVRDKNARNYSSALLNVQSILAAYPQALATSDLWKQIFNAPAWFSRSSEPGEYFDYAYEVMGSVIKACDALPQPEAVKLAEAFILGAQFRLTVHNDKNILPFMERRAHLFSLLLSSTGIRQDYQFPTTVSAGGKIKFGVMFKHLKNDPELTSVLPFFDGIRSEDIDVTVFLEVAKGNEECASYVASVSDRIVPLPKDLGGAVSTIRKHDLDILLFANDITAKPSLFSYLSFFRIARKTACYVSTIATTASPYVDLYFGANYYSKRNCDSEFREEFIEFPDPGYAFWLPKGNTGEDVVVSREKLGLPADAVLLVSAANLTKLHADLINAWAEILTAVPKAYLMLRPFPPHFGPAREEVTRRLHSDFSKLGISEERVIISLPLPGRDEVVKLLGQMDIGLDSFPYSGLTTIVDAIEAGLPIICYAGARLRNSHGAATLYSVGATELIAESRQEYIDLAIELARDSEKRERLRKYLKSSEKPFLNSNGFAKAAGDIYRKLYHSL